MAFTKNYLAPSISYYQLLRVDRHHIFSLGWTLRAGSYYANAISYTTAPARLTRETLASPNTDTFSFNYATGTMLNVGIRAQIRLGILDVGGSVDLLGIAFGRGRIGTYGSSTGKFVLGQTKAGTDSLVSFQGIYTQQRAEPSRLNGRFGGDNDRGSLATEVYARIHLNQRVGIKAAYQWLTTEMTATTTNVVADNDRFRNRTGGIPYVAVTFFLFD